MHLNKVIHASAFILAGGMSRRFQVPKWDVQIKGVSLLDRAWNLCSPLFESTSIVTKKGNYKGDRSTIFDISEIQAPLAGIHATLDKRSPDGISLYRVIYL